MNKKSIGNVSRLDPYPTLDSVPLSFSIECCNTRRSYTYDLETLSSQYATLSRAFAWSMLSNRSSVGHSTRERGVGAIRIFYNFLDVQKNAQNLQHPSDIDTALLRHYAQWLMRQKDRSYRTQSVNYRSLGSMIKRWIGKSWAASKLIFPEGQFPGANATGSTRKAYSAAELRQIVQGIKLDLQAAAKKLEMPYEPKYLNKPPPTEDVAPYNEQLPYALQHNPWQNDEYCIWWWENSCQCKRMKIAEIQRLHKGNTFLRSLSKEWKCFRSNFRGTAKRLEQFYESIGAGDDYIPRFLGKPCPIKYFNRWKKMEYLQWYWENHCNSSMEVYGAMRQKYPRFINAIREHHGSLVEFFEFVGVTHKITVFDLVPYYLGLLVSTALNPSTIRTLEIDCLSQDPLDDQKLSLNWTKLRARTQGQTIPAKRLNGFSPVSIVERLIALTAPFRQENQRQLFITNSANSGSRKGYSITKAMFSRAVTRFFDTHGIKADPDSFNGNSSFSIASGARFRNTIAQHEYRRTGKLEYLQTLLSHSRAEQTSNYIQKNGDPVLRFRRGIHLEALFVGITSCRENGVSFIEQHGLSSQKIRGDYLKDRWHKSISAHCRDPLASPVHGQRVGIECSAHDVCLYCQNLVITPEDLVRYFAFVFYHEKKLEQGALTRTEFSTSVDERRHIFEGYILPRYSEESIARARHEAATNPPIEWMDD